MYGSQGVARRGAAMQGALGRARGRQGSSCVRTAIFIFIVTFLWLQLHMANFSTASKGGGGGRQSTSTESDSSLQQLLSVVPVHLHKFLLPLNISANSTAPPPLPPPYNISSIKEAIKQLNSAQVVLNEDIFGPLQSDSLVIVVQVGKAVFCYMFLDMLRDEGKFKMFLG